MLSLRGSHLDFSEKEPDRSRHTDFDTLINNTYRVIYPFLMDKELAKMAGVSRRQRELSENDMHWKARAIPFNAYQLMTKSSIRLFYVLSKTSIYEEYDGQYYDISVSVIVKNPDTNKISYYDSLVYIHCEIDKQPIIAYWIMQEPIFRELLASKYPKELKQKWIDETAKKIAGAIIGGFIGFAAATLCAAVLLPVWLISFAIAVMTFGISLLAKGILSAKLVPFDTLFTVINSTVHGVRAGYYTGVRGIGTVIKDSAKAIYASYFTSKRFYTGFDFCVPESCSHLHSRNDTIADTAKQQQSLLSQSLFAAKPCSKEIDKSAHLVIPPLRM